MMIKLTPSASAHFLLHYLDPD